MLKEGGLQPRLGYRPKGEEVDGSIWMHGRTILLEAKWTESPHPASSLYQFRGKVEGKLRGTLGLFVSTSGFSSDAVDALVAGKEMSLILMDGDDLRRVARNEISITAALERKLRAAGENGTPFLPLSAPVKQPSLNKQVVFVEGRVDARALTIVHEEYRSSGAQPVVIIPSGGPGNMVPLLQTMMQLGPMSNVFMVVDADRFSSRLESKVADAVEAGDIDSGVSIIAVEPTLEDALGIASEVRIPGRLGTLRQQRHDDELRRMIKSADLIDRAKTNPSLAQVLRCLGVQL